MPTATIDPERIILGCGNFGGVGSLPNLLGLGEDETPLFQDSCRVS